MKHGSGFKNLKGEKFGRLTVLDIDEEKSKPKIIYWKCRCDCGNIKSILRSQLTSGKTQSCGCLQKEYTKTCPVMKRKAYNKYIEYEDYMECILSNGKSTIFDKADYELIKQYSWNWNVGYSYTIIKDKYVPMHFILFNDYLYDHKNRNKLDNRRCNLRKCTYTENNQNISLKVNNTSGVTGVNLDSRGRWIARVTVNGKRKTVYAGWNFEEAVVARLKAENKYYGEFAPQKHLYEQYGVK